MRRLEAARSAKRKGAGRSSEIRYAPADMAYQQLISEAEEWISQDASEADREALKSLVELCRAQLSARSSEVSGEHFETPELKQLVEWMGPEPSFGTAGLRGIVGPGRGRMNLSQVIRATSGLADYLLARIPDAKTLPVVIGYDARPSSAEFAFAARRVLVARGIPVRYFTEPVPTPLVAYAARQLSASAAVCVTASHNPPEYNGYKVYDSAHKQISEPMDREIAARIAAGGAASQVRLAPLDEETGELVDKQELSEAIAPELSARYFDELDAARPKLLADRSLPIVYTPLHGVGGRFALQALTRAGFNQIFPVAEQFEPNGAFPTLRFPNPEEPAALELAEREANARDAELILANDPDADRLAVCVRSAAGRWVSLSGNQIGILLADLLLSIAPPTPPRLVISTIVSTPMLGQVAEAYGARFEQSLTGFKWIWRAALELAEREGLNYVFGFEEAIGYSAGHLVRDKDGISAALYFAELAASLKARETNVLEHLQQLYRRYGLWVSAQRNLSVAGGAERDALMSRLRSRAAAGELLIAGYELSQLTDFALGGAERPSWLPDTDLVQLELRAEGGVAGRALVRPSGTEPKVKIYVDLNRSLEGVASVTLAEAELEAQAAQLAEELARLLQSGDGVS